MIPASIQHYLQHNRVLYERYWHPRAVTAQELAQALHVSGWRVAKSVIVMADRQPWIFVVPAAGTVDLARVQELLGCRTARLATEREFSEHFPDCELGAEPPFGELYGLPVAVDETLSLTEHLLIRAGSHEEALEMRFQDFATLEWPLVASFIHEGLQQPVPSVIPITPLLMEQEAPMPA
ncbi:YbaK/EbsC family protein [Myxococcus llanfairpwllgwyngyllgogerychwyrndrobwllllantysiliogogogochensis]|uniref:YbaK/EbsC family protein n=1 Tax=Myxococcus llanfairpwllgwyngyllgogerychwyrndrobwllllantysiliogogogochensis TaxID=2590453 RepID=A0A540WUN2_9BACT|nr:YbaK/EbsC family protein [Myxococcus llanfairpwllgwyngyllgogerychwyrndrobwllllantysiliogogogochensis]TQF12722.1 YbaK/EbsC family protein [Myxococcus llanfairpwllgwyngyllgogerychwyrndrobwllllantysiliogogogochensis]